MRSGVRSSLPTNPIPNISCVARSCQARPRWRSTTVATAHGPVARHAGAQQQVVRRVARAQVGDDGEAEVELVVGRQEVGVRRPRGGGRGDGRVPRLGRDVDGDRAEAGNDREHVAADRGLDGLDQRAHRATPGRQRRPSTRALRPRRAPGHVDVDRARPGRRPWSRSRSPSTARPSSRRRRTTAPACPRAGRRGGRRAPARGRRCRCRTRRARPPRPLGARLGEDPHGPRLRPRRAAATSSTEQQARPAPATCTATVAAPPSAGDGEPHRRGRAGDAEAPGGRAAPRRPPRPPPSVERPSAHSDGPSRQSLGEPMRPYAHGEPRDARSA